MNLVRVHLLCVCEWKCQLETKRAENMMRETDNNGNDT